MIKHGDWGWSSFCTNPHPTPLSTTRLLCWNLSPSSASGFGGTPGTFDSSVMWNSCNRIAEFLEILSRALSKQSQGRRQWKSKMHAICWNLAHICRILNVHWFRMATELRGAHANVCRSWPPWHNRRHGPPLGPSSDVFLWCAVLQNTANFCTGLLHTYSSSSY